MEHNVQSHPTSEQIPSSQGEIAEMRDRSSGTVRDAG